MVSVLGATKLVEDKNRCQLFAKNSSGCTNHSARGVPSYLSASLHRRTVAQTLRGTNNFDSSSLKHYDKQIFRKRKENSKFNRCGRR